LAEAVNPLVRFVCPKRGSGGSVETGPFHRAAKAQMRTVKVMGLISLGWLVAFFLSISYGLASRPEQSETTALVSTNSSVAKAACEMIYQGKFEDARSLIDSVEQPQEDEQIWLESLRKIIDEYVTIDQRRKSTWEKQYNEQLESLKKFQADPNTDTDDINDISSVLAVVASAEEYADEAQKQKLLSDPFVKEIFQKAKAKSAEYEAKGDWLESYITCYSWLGAIDEENQQYSDYSEQLIEKANIVSSFQDSPCETSNERYEGVKKEMFIQAINALNFNYVNPVDYRQMSLKAIKRCKMLAEVMEASYEQIQENNQNFARPRSDQLSTWSAFLDALLDEVNQSLTGVTKDKFLEIFDKVLALNDVSVELSPNVLIAQFTEAALSSLDPYTVMVWPQQVQEFEKIMTNEFTGVGIEITKEKGLLTVTSLLPDTPAYYSGLDAGDIIEAADGEDTKDMSLTCAVRKITGPAGTEVTLTVKSPGDEQNRDITITRAKIVVPTIRGWQRTEQGGWLYVIDDENKIGYIRLTSFSSDTASNLERALVDLEAQGMRGLILDLRFNSGGLLDSAVAITDKFVGEGLIVSTRSRFGIPTYPVAHGRGTHPGYPLVVLINRYSASASEIVAGALADPKHERAVLVGERTHGKGSVQGIAHYPDGNGQLKYTMAYYHLPSGQRVESRDAMEKLGRDDWGVGPDVEVEFKSNEFRERLDIQRKNDVLVKADHDVAEVPLEKHSSEDVLAADAQLAVARLVVMTKLLEQSL
jgi:carboxyl-terminal processing protease